MSLRRISVDELCKDGLTCPSVWEDDADVGDLVIVGYPVASGVPLANGEVAVRVKRQVVADAKIR